MLTLSNLYSNWNISLEYLKTLKVSVLRFQCDVDYFFGQWRLTLTYTALHNKTLFIVLTCVCRAQYMFISYSWV